MDFMIPLIEKLDPTSAVLVVVIFLLYKMLQKEKEQTWKIMEGMNNLTRTIDKFGLILDMLIKGAEK